MAEPITAPRSLMPLRPGELRLMGALALAEDSAEIVLTATPGPRFALRGAFLRWYLAKAIPDTKQPVTRVQLERFHVEGPLRLDGCKLVVQPIFVYCCFSHPVDLTGAEVPGVTFLNGVIPAIFADRVTVTGSLLIRVADGSVGPSEVVGVISLNGARVHGNLELDGTVVRGASHSGGHHLAIEADGLSVAGNVLLRNGFHAFSEVRLNGAKVTRNIDCSGGTLENPAGFTLSAAGAQISGTLYLGSSDAGAAPARPRFTSLGALRLDGANIRGDLDCSNGSFTATAFHDANWAPGNARGHCIYAITANGVQVGADVNLMGRFRSSGTLSFINARIGNDLKCFGAFFHSPGGEAFCGDGMTVDGTVFLTAGGDTPFRSNGVLRYVLAKIGQSFYVRDAVFEAAAPLPKWLHDSELLVRELDGPACGLLATEAAVSGTFEWKGITGQRGANAYPFRLDIAAARADIVDDDLASWMQLDRFDVNDCEFRSMSRLFDRSESDGWLSDLGDYVEARLRLLDCEYAAFNRTCREFALHHGMTAPPLYHAPIGDISSQQAVDRFKPQPYMQLARVLHRFGLDAAAEDVLVHLEQNRTRYSGYGVMWKLWRRCLQLGLRYGYNTKRPVLILAVWAVFSALIFESSYSAGRIVPTASNVIATPAPHPRVQFNALIFAVDTLVPIVSLNQKQNWVVDPLSRNPNEGRGRKLGFFESLYPLWRTSPDRPAALLVIFNTFFGWLLTTLFAAGVSGLLRRGGQ
jgi:hypothetical protein